MPYSASDDQQPVMWLNGRPVYASYFVVLVYVVLMIVTTLVMTFGIRTPFDWLPFDSTAVLRGEVWRVLTYGLLNPPSLGFVVDMVMIVWFGRELERFFGRRLFFVLFGCLYLLSPLLFTAIGVWRPMYLLGQTGSFAIFIAFATLYPGAVLIFNILAKWFAIILVAIYTLMHLASHNLAGLISLWVTVGFAFGFVRYHQGQWTLPRFRLPRRKPGVVQKKDFAMGELDAVLDKIAASGFGSLTAAERAKLEAGKAMLEKRNRGR